MVAAWEYFTNEKQWKAYLKDLLQTNDGALLKSIVLIYNNQTTEEKEKCESIDDNYVGFTKIDAFDLGNIAKKIQDGQQLTKAEFARCRNKMPKYWKQLMMISKKRSLEKRAELSAVKEAVRIRDDDVLASDASTRQLLFKEHNDTLRRCSEEGVSCEYGICNECPITTGFQLRLDVG